jgi:hypothetical protein
MAKRMITRSMSRQGTDQLTMVLQGMDEADVCVLITNHLKAPDIMNLMLSSRVFIHNNYFGPMIIGQLKHIYESMERIMVDYLQKMRFFRASNCLLDAIYAFFDKRYRLMYVSHMEILRVIHSWTNIVKLAYKNNDDNSSIFESIMQTIEKHECVVHIGLNVFYYTGPFGKMLIKDRYTRMQTKRGGMYVVAQLIENGNIVEHLGLVKDHDRSKGVCVQIENHADVWLPEIGATWRWA